MKTNTLALKGRTIKEIYQDDFNLMFKLENDEVFIFYHWQDCCEDVRIEQIDGEINDLIGSELLMAEEVIDYGETEWGSATWTFYKFATIKGYVTVRWEGVSNGYYSESVDMGIAKAYKDFEPMEIEKNIDYSLKTYIHKEETTTIDLF